MPEPISINLKELKKALQIPEFGWKIYWNLYEIKGEQMDIGHIVNGLIRENYKKNKGMLFSDYEHKCFLPCLINYLAIVDSFFAHSILNYYYGIALQKEQNESFLNFLKNHLQQTFAVYESVITNIHLKEISILEWIKTKEISNSIYKTKQASKLFELTEEQVSILIDGLLKNKIIEPLEAKNTKYFFKNQPVLNVKFKTTQIALIDLLKRIVYHTNKPKLSKKEIAKFLSERVFYFNTKTANYRKIDFKYAKNTLSSTTSFPPPNKRLLLSLFSDND